MDQGSARLPRSQFGVRGVEREEAVAERREAVVRDSNNSKRTLVIALVTLGAAGAAGAFVMQGGAYTANNTPKVFASIAECVAAKTMTTSDCQSRWDAAFKFHNLSAPAFGSAAECEKIYGAGKCVQPQTPDNPERMAKFIPAMAGIFYGPGADVTYQGAPVYKTAADGSSRYRVTEPEHATESADGATSPRAGGGGGAFAFMFLRSAAASAPASAAAKPGSSLLNPASMAPARAGGSAPAGQAVSRGGFGGSAHASAGG